MATVIERPGDGECSSYYMGYVGLAPEGDVLALLAAQPGELADLLRGLSDEQAASRFAPGEWSIKEVVGHLADAERILAYRAFTISRQEGAVLPGFDPDDFVREAAFGARSLPDLLDELASLRAATVRFARHLTPETSRRRGAASGEPTSVRALVHILVGHVNHHLADLREQYLPSLAPR